MDSLLKGKTNEKHVANFLRNYFQEVHMAEIEIGDDIVCHYPHKNIFLIKPFKQIEFKFQAKCNYIKSNYIPININSFWRNVQSLARSTFFFIYTKDFEIKLKKIFLSKSVNTINPTHYLNLYNWMLVNNYKDYLNKSGTKINIPKSHFNQFSTLSDKTFIDEMQEEIDRINIFINDMNSSFSKINIELTFREFGFICRNFDLPHFTLGKLRKIFENQSIQERNDAIQILKEEIKNNDFYSNIYKKVFKDKKHPLDFVSPSTFIIKKEFIMKQYNNYKKGESYVLCENFNVIDMAVARSLSATIPNLLQPCIDIFNNYINYPNSVKSKDVCCAMLMLSSMYFIFDKNTLGEKILNIFAPNKIYNLFKAIDIFDLDTYRIKLHYFVAYSEITGNKKSAEYAVNLAETNSRLELMHLKHYGWPSNFDAVELYSRSTQINTLRGKNLQNYNQLMSSLLKIINLNLKYGGKLK